MSKTAPGEYRGQLFWVFDVCESVLFATMAGIAAQAPESERTAWLTGLEHQLRVDAILGARRAVAGRPRGGDLALSGTEMRALWTHSEAVPGLASGASPEPFLDEPEESDEHTRLEDEAMRMIEEVSVPADTDRRGGIDLRYDDDDL